MLHAQYNVVQLHKCLFFFFADDYHVNTMSICEIAPSHLEFILFPVVEGFAPYVLLQVHVVFERLSGGREGDRGQKLNHQTTKHTHGKREGEKGKEKEGREGRGKQSFRFFIRREQKTKTVSAWKRFWRSFRTWDDRSNRAASSYCFSRTSRVELFPQSNMAVKTSQSIRRCVCVCVHVSFYPYCVCKCF